MRVGLIGTGAIAHKHAQAYGELGYKLAAAANRNADKGRAYAEQYGAEFRLAPRNRPRMRCSRSFGVAAEAHGAYS